MTANVALTEKQLVVFGLAGETYGVDISTVREIIQMQEITAVPGTARYVKGITNLRGTIIPVIDLGKRFGLAESARNKNTRIVVINSGENPIGVIVDSVDEVLRVPADSIEPPSQMIMNDHSEYLLGIAKVAGKLVILLDTDKMLSRDDYQAANMVAQDTKSKVKRNGDDSAKSGLLLKDKESQTIK